MKKISLTVSILIILFMSTYLTSASALEHPAENTCDDICQAEVICLAYVEEFPNRNQRDIFYAAIDETNIELVEIFCVHQKGLIIT